MDSEEKYQAIFENRQSAVLLMEPETGRIVEANATAGHQGSIAAGRCGSRDGTTSFGHPRHPRPATGGARAPDRLGELPQARRAARAKAW